MSQHWRPVRVDEIDLLIETDSVEDPVTVPTSVRVLVRAHTRVLGVSQVDLEPGEGLEHVRDQLKRAYSGPVERHTARHACGLTNPTGAEDTPCLVRRREVLSAAPTLSILVATHDRPQLLARCLDSILRQSHQPLDVVVVDNARSSDAAERLLESDHYRARRIRYVREDRPGLARAHNAGLPHVQGEVVAITDDDVVVDRQWTAALLEAFVQHRPACVTGLIVPVEIETQEQAWVEQYGGFARGFEQRVYSLASPPPDQPLFPFTAGRLGSGANMAFETDALRRMGGFDPALGAGTKARGGDDLAAFARTILSGATLVYQPDAVVHHPHHRTMADLERMAHGYGAGLGAYLTSLVVSDPGLAKAMLPRAWSGARHFLSRNSSKNRNIEDDYPRHLVTRERRGLVQGPFLYASSRRDGRSGRGA